MKKMPKAGSLFADLKTHDLFDLSHCLLGEKLGALEYPWEALPFLSTWIREIGQQLPQSDYDEIQPEVWVSRKASVAPTAYIQGPCIVMAETEIRHGAYIRGSVLIGEGCVVGNSTELKNVILFDGVQVPHYNYVGDSILGYRAHMGAGSITSNVKADKTLVVIGCGSEKYETGLKKMGAMIGDFVEVGCNSVLNPGTVIGMHTSIYPLSLVRGVVPAHSIYKTQGGVIVPKHSDHRLNGQCE